jgi:hypothetical protein
LGAREEFRAVRVDGDDVLARRDAVPFDRESRLDREALARLDGEQRRVAVALPPRQEPGAAVVRDAAVLIPRSVRISAPVFPGRIAAAASRIDFRMVSNPFCTGAGAAVSPRFRTYQVRCRSEQYPFLRTPKSTLTMCPGSIGLSVGPVCAPDAFGPVNTAGHWSASHAGVSPGVRAISSTISAANRFSVSPAFRRGVTASKMPTVTSHASRMSRCSEAVFRPRSAATRRSELSRRRA